MLILTRRPAETIYIGDEVTITVLGVVGNQVRFGIEAPRSITIDRAEIHERKRRAALAHGNLAHGNPARGNMAPGNLTSASPADDDLVAADEVNGNIDAG